MELKHRQNIISIRNNTSFNRTFMELKQAVAKRVWGQSPRFNRTFMELKQGKTDKEQAQNIVLIAPLWN